MGSVVKYDRTLFEPEHDLFRESYRAFLDRHVAPHHEQWEKDKIVDRGVWLEAGKQGFLGMAVPEEYGGGGDPDFRYNVIVTEETTAGRYSGIGFGLHNDVIAPYLLRLTTEEQKQRWLPQFCTGELITAIAMTEPGTGSDLQGIKTRAVKQGDHYVLNGAKTFITNGINSDLVIVVACTDPDKGAQGFSLLVVERGMEGFERGRKLDKIGLDAQDTAELSFTDVAKAARASGTRRRTTPSCGPMPRCPMPPPSRLATGRQAVRIRISLRRRPAGGALGLKPRTRQRKTAATGSARFLTVKTTRSLRCPSRTIPTRLTPRQPVSSWTSQPVPSGTTRPLSSWTSQPVPSGTTRPLSSWTSQPVPSGTTRPLSSWTSQPVPSGTTRPPAVAMRRWRSTIRRPPGWRFTCPSMIPIQAPDGYPVKADTQSGLYWTPDSGLYDDARAEIWFASEEFARTNGFVRAD